MRVQFRCGHIFDQPDDWPQFKPEQLCSVCRRSVELVAVECREFKVSCAFNCRFARWTGQSKELACVIGARHGHVVTVDYLAPEAKKKKLKQLYPPRVKHYIDAQPWDKFPMYSDPGDKYPEHPPF